MTAVVIYAFRSPGSGAVYVGKHECDPDGWPRRGNGRLPDGYKGSGDVVPRFHARHGAAVQWRILAVVSLDDWPRAERRAVDLARAIFGRKCVNIRGGGRGLSSAESRAMLADPEIVKRQRQASRQAMDRPEVREKMRAAQLGKKLSPDTCAKLSAVKRGVPKKEAHKAEIGAAIRAFRSAPINAERMAALSREHARRPERNAKLSASLKGQPKSDEARRNMSIAAKRRCARDKARRALAPFAVPPPILRRGVTLWAFLPTLRLSIAGPKGPARRR